MKTYTQYEFTYFYGGCFGNHECYTNLAEVWKAYKEHKAYGLADGGAIRRITRQRKLFGKDAIVRREDVISWRD